MDGKNMTAASQKEKDRFRIEKIGCIFQDFKLINEILVANIRSAEALAELANENYSFEKKYLEQFGTEDLVYTLNKGEELNAQMQSTYSEFVNWLGSWEM